MIVLDASVVIGLLDAADALHAESQRLFDEHLDAEFALPVLTRAEVLVGPSRAGRAADAARRLDALEIRTIALLESDALPLAALRARTGLKLPDACVLLAGAARQGAVATFDGRLRRAAADLGLETLPSTRPA